MAVATSIDRRKEKPTRPMSRVYVLIFIHSIYMPKWWVEWEGKKRCQAVQFMRGDCEIVGCLGNAAQADRRWLSDSLHHPLPLTQMRIVSMLRIFRVFCRTMSCVEIVKICEKEEQGTLFSLPFWEYSKKRRNLKQLWGFW